MIGFALLVFAAGIFLILRPDVWWAINKPSDPSLRRIRRQGWALAIGSVALFIVQLFK